MQASDRATGRADQALSWRGLWLLATIHAACFALAFPPLDLWPLVFVAPLPFAWAALRARSALALSVAIFVTQLAMWLWLLHWIIPVTAAGYPALSAYMSLFPFMLALLLRASVRCGITRHVPMIVLLPVFWTAMDFARGQVAFNGYPWYFLAHPLIHWLALVQIADLGGTYFVSTIACVPAAATVMVRMTSDQSSRRGIRQPWIAAAVVILLYAAVVVYGSLRLGQSSTFEPGPTILSIQTNLPQDNKIDQTREQEVETFISFCDLTLNQARNALEHGQRFDLVVWPETMVPGFGFEPQALEYLVTNRWQPGDMYARAIEDLAQELHAPMLVGSPAYLGLRVVDRTFLSDHKYNSAYLIQGSPPYQRYDKYFLTPFGETMPYISNWPWLQQKMLDLGARGMKFDLDSNPNIQRLTLHSADASASSAPAAAADDRNLTRRDTILATPICFEDTVSPLCRRMIYDAGNKRADLFVNISNDGWFNTSDADRRLHAQIARFRCIENRVPMVRSVNTGLSMHIDSCGRIVNVVGSGRYGTGRTAGSVTAATQLDTRGTLYGRIGEMIGWLCLAGSISCAIISYVRRRSPAVLPG